MSDFKLGCRFNFLLWLWRVTVGLFSKFTSKPKTAVNADLKSLDIQIRQIFFSTFAMSETVLSVQEWKSVIIPHLLNFYFLKGGNCSCNLFKLQVQSVLFSYSFYFLFVLIIHLDLTTAWPELPELR